MLASKGRFFPVLEGASVNLDRTFARISADSRHIDLEVVQRLEMSSRLFSDWAMAAARVSPDITPEIDRAIDARQASPTQAVDALIAWSRDSAAEGQACNGRPRP